ncbi:TadE/TadG family type IV pilus assembly protein [Novosphingobium sp.]|uniref:TadE/TadG family type IV pilus assembly protein n=1 Tax=Novosphingobium sp. TaxID=1874826 RepID=UPI002FDADADF
MNPLFDRLRARCRRLAADNRGAALIEAAVIAPVLVLLAIGGFEVSRMVSRQSELQSGASDAEAIALAANAGAATDTTTLKSILMSKLSLSSDQVDVTKRYRCDAATTLVNSADSCSGGAVVSTYVEIQLRDTFTPIWSRIGVAGTLNYNVDRLVQLS